MLGNLLKPENIILNLESESKDELFAEMVESIVRTNPSINRGEVISAIEEREEKQNTCIMTGIAVPHASCTSVSSPAICIGVSKEGIDYEIDGKTALSEGNPPVHLVILILFEPGNTEFHMRILSEVASLAQNGEFYKSALTASSVQQFVETIKNMEKSL